MKNQIKEQKLEATVYNSFLRRHSRIQQRELSGALVNETWLAYSEEDTRVNEVALLMFYKLNERHQIKVNINIRHDAGYFNDTFTANNKDWFEDVAGQFTKYMIFNDDFSLVLFQDEKDNIVLDQIRVVEKGQGLGTKVIDTLLDICDDHDWTCVTVPTALEQEGDQELQEQLGMVGTYQLLTSRTQRLRKFYADFGFIGSPFTAKMIYKP